MCMKEDNPGPKYFQGRQLLKYYYIIKKIQKNHVVVWDYGFPLVSWRKVVVNMKLPISLSMNNFDVILGHKEKLQRVLNQ